MTDDEQEVVFDGSDDESFDYGAEVEQLTNQDDSDGQDRQLINLAEGKNTIKFLSEPSHEEWNYGTEEEPDVAEKMVFEVELVEGKVEVDGNTRSADEIDGDEELHYAVTKGSTEQSQWGQLAKVGEARDGLEGEEVTIFRNGSGKSTSYLVQDAAELND